MLSRVFSDPETDHSAAERPSFTESAEPLATSKYKLVQQFPATVVVVDQEKCLP